MPASVDEKEVSQEKSEPEVPTLVAMTRTTVVETESTSTVASTSQQDPDEIQDQSVRLPFHRLLLIYFGIGTALSVSFLDQTSVSTAAPVIGGDIGGSDRWAQKVKLQLNMKHYMARDGFPRHQLRDAPGLRPVIRHCEQVKGAACP